MGLDQSVYAVKFCKEIPDFVSSEYCDSFLPVEFDYWGKFWSLQKWMENLYREKGGTEKDFNNIHLRLTEQDIERLDHDSDSDDFYKNHSVHRTLEQEIEIEYEHLKNFIKTAKENVNRDYLIYYYCSW